MKFLPVFLLSIVFFSVEGKKTRSKKSSKGNQIDDCVYRGPVFNFYEKAVYIGLTQVVPIEALIGHVGMIVDALAENVPLLDKEGGIDEIMAKGANAGKVHITANPRPISYAEICSLAHGMTSMMDKTCEFDENVSAYATATYYFTKGFVQGYGPGAGFDTDVDILECPSQVTGLTFGELYPVDL